ncbi:MAG: DUF4176 domain-containing protein [Lachnospiraceae bacterium]|nr:DUF4176 domain-containing protein [Lachnospiraceae bacterium]
MKEYLPIGTVVRLHNGTKEIMIYGRMQRAMSTGQIYDYVACLYPEGHLDNEHTFLFNKTDIEQVVFVGYQSETDKILQEKMNLLV